MTLIISDTHLGKYDREKKFITTGCIMGDFTSYVVIDDNGVNTINNS